MSLSESTEQSSMSSRRWKHPAQGGTDLHQSPACTSWFPVWCFYGTPKCVNGWVSWTFPSSLTAVNFSVPDSLLSLACIPLVVTCLFHICSVLSSFHETLKGASTSWDRLLVPFFPSFCCEQTWCFVSHILNCLHFVLFDCKPLCHPVDSNAVRK